MYIKNKTYAPPLLILFEYSYVILFRIRFFLKQEWIKRRSPISFLFVAGLRCLTTYIRLLTWLSFFFFWLLLLLFCFLFAARLFWYILEQNCCKRFVIVLFELNYVFDGVLKILSVNFLWQFFYFIWLYFSPVTLPVMHFLNKNYIRNLRRR